MTTVCCARSNRSQIPNTNGSEVLAIDYQPIIVSPVLIQSEASAVVMCVHHAGICHLAADASILLNSIANPYSEPSFCCGDVFLGMCHLAASHVCRCTCQGLSMHSSFIT